MYIGELADCCGLSRDAIRFYEKEGLLKAARGRQGYRIYESDAVYRLGLVKRAKDLGFSLAEISSLLDVWASHTLPVAQKRQIVHTKIADVDARMAQLQALRADLMRALDDIHEDCPDQA